MTLTEAFGIVAGAHPKMLSEGSFEFDGYNCSALDGITAQFDPNVPNDVLGVYGVTINYHVDGVVGAAILISPFGDEDRDDEEIHFMYVPSS